MAYPPIITLIPNGVLPGQTGVTIASGNGTRLAQYVGAALANIDLPRGYTFYCKRITVSVDVAQQILIMAGETAGPAVPDADRITLWRQEVSTANPEYLSPEGEWLFKWQPTQVGDDLLNTEIAAAHETSVINLEIEGWVEP